MLAADAAKHLAVFYGTTPPPPKPSLGPLGILSSCLRGMLCAAPGNDLMAADFASIEGRGLPWLAGEDWKVDAFRAFDAGLGPEIYKLGASEILEKPIADITADERQTYGKVPELACGYQGGVGAFQQMAKTYLVKVPNDVAEFAKNRWREKHPKIVTYWRDLEDAAFGAVTNPARAFVVGPVGRQVAYKVSGSFLWCRLPSGRVLCYPYPRIMPKEMPWGAVRDVVTYMTVPNDEQFRKKQVIEDPVNTKAWARVSTYGGKLAENVTQAICRDLLVYAIRQAEAAGYPVVLHVHDEVVAEVPKGFGDLKEFESICGRAPKWAAGLPVVAKGWRGERYRKD